MIREEKILTTLERLGFANRKQLQVTNNLGGIRNANRILKEMERDKLINSVRYEEKIYYVDYKGQGRISNKRQLRKGLILHTLMRNDLYIYFKIPKDWEVERTIDFDYKDESKTIIPDALFTSKGERYFIEVDNTQQMQNNYDKLKSYQQLSKIIMHKEHHTPTIIYYTLTPQRKKLLEKEINKLGLKGHVFKKGDF